jgi:histidinol-phosphatase
VNDIRGFLDFAVGLSQLAGAHVLGLYGKNNLNTVRYKQDGTEVTSADTEAEEIIRTHIENQYPSHGIQGEEFGLLRGKSRYRWVIDPVDGTLWYRLGVPIFGTLIALLEDGEPQVGVIYFPVSNETVYAGRGLGCWHAGRSKEAERVRVAPVADLERATVSVSGIHNSTIRPGGTGPLLNLLEIMRRAGQFYFCGDCLQYALLCCGNVHLAIDAAMKPWDTAAIIPCVEEAGGVVTGLDGRRDGIVQAGNLIAASDPRLLRAALACLSKL